MYKPHWPSFTSRKQTFRELTLKNKERTIVFFPLLFSFYSSCKIPTGISVKNWPALWSVILGPDQKGRSFWSVETHDQNRLLKLVSWSASPELREILVSWNDLTGNFFFTFFIFLTVETWGRGRWVGYFPKCLKTLKIAGTPRDHFEKPVLVM